MHNDDDLGFWKWFTPKEKNPIELMPISLAKPVKSIEKYSNLTLQATKQLVKATNFGEMTDLIQVIHTAQTKTNIKPFNLGKYIFNHSFEDKEHILASLMVIKVGQYLTKMQANDLHPFSRKNLPPQPLYENKNQQEQSNQEHCKIQAAHCLYTLNFKRKNKKINLLEDHRILATELVFLIMLHSNSPLTLRYMAEIFYANTSPETKNNTELT